jgi:hypothetical protein
MIKRSVLEEQGIGGPYNEEVIGGPSQGSGVTFPTGGAYRGENVPPPPQPPQVALESDLIAQNADLLGKQAEELAQRLEVLLRPTDAVRANGPEVNNGKPIAPYVGYLRGQNEKLRRISDRLADILDRLEI